MLTDIFQHFEGSPSDYFLKDLESTPNKYFWSKEYLAKSAEDKQTELWT